MTPERRDSFRCAIQPEDQSVRVQVNGAIFPATLVNESAGGFSVKIDSSVPVEPGIVLAVHTASGSSEARVAHIDRLTEETLLGLERVRDIPPPTEDGNSCIIKDLVDQSGQRLSSNAAILMFGIGLVLGFCVLLFVWKPPSQSSSVNEPRTPDKAVPFAASDSSKDNAAQQQERRASESSRLRRYLERSMAQPKSSDDLVARFRLPVVESFEALSLIITPDVVESLRLTDQQQRAIEGIVERTSLELSQLVDGEVAATGERQEEEAAELTEDAWRQVSEILTERQRRLVAEREVPNL
jgi:hypothetical protein